jgi:predicted AAA+ superfamily ATPase
LPPRQARRHGAPITGRNHVYTRYYRQSIGFSYWKGRKDREVDNMASVEGRLVPFEAKYRAQATGAGDLKRLEQFCADRKVARGYVITNNVR